VVVIVAVVVVAVVVCKFVVVEMDRKSGVVTGKWMDGGWSRGTWHAWEKRTRDPDTLLRLGLAPKRQGMLTGGQGGPE